MDRSQDKMDAANSSLKLLQNYDSSDSCDDTDDANHNNIDDSKPNASSSSVLSSARIPQSVESDISSIAENSQSLSIDSEMDNVITNDNAVSGEMELVLKNNLKNLSEHGPVDNAAEDGANAPAVEEKNEVIDCEMMASRDGNRWSADESSSDDSSQDSDSDSSEWESLKGVEANSDSDEANSNTKSNVPNKMIAPKVKGELDLEDLPPIQDLAISVPNKECVLMGTIYDIVDRLVIVEAFPNKPTLDLDTVLFLDEGARTLGQIYDVFGQVFKPFYCVRFNSKDHINEKGIVCGMCVYCAPKTEHTNLVFVSDLMRMKGSDASWKDDVEPPSQFLEFSDDEEERKAKHLLKEQKKKANATAEVGESSETNANKRHKPTPYEERMNRKNLQKTAEFSKRNQPPQSVGFGRGRAQPYNPFGPRYDTVGQPPATEIQWTPSNSFYMSRNPMDFMRQRFRMEPPRDQRTPFRPGSARFTSFPPPGLWFMNRAPGAPWPPPPPPGFPGS